MEKEHAYWRPSFGMNICSNCGLANNVESKFCPNCGAEMDAPAPDMYWLPSDYPGRVKCPYCGADIMIGYEHNGCPMCGKKVKEKK